MAPAVYPSRAAVYHRLGSWAYMLGRYNRSPGLARMVGANKQLHRGLVMTAAMGRRREASQPANDRRYAIRINVHIDAELLDQGRRRCAVTLTNLSITGCRFESDQPLRLPAPITLLIDDIDPIVGEVVWKEGRLIGCHFAEPLSPTICNRIIRSLRERSARL